ncbi:hypothetical protein AFLA_008186 [Aspergillus flavus NRRL3357]|nr:hypothetical protein AFLA_008186 [Aspergillus flavus NRRL3357]
MHSKHLRQVESLTGLIDTETNIGYESYLLSGRFSVVNAWEVYFELRSRLVMSRKKKRIFFSPLNPFSLVNIILLQVNPS